MLDYNDLANMTFADLPDEKELPDGNWLLQKRNGAVLAPKEEGDKIRVVLFFNVVAAGDDIPEDALAELGDDYDLAMNQIVKTWWIETTRDWKEPKKVLSLLGVDVTSKDTDIIEAVKSGGNGNKVWAYLTKKSFTHKQTGETRTDTVPSNFAEYEG